MTFRTLRALWLLLLLVPAACAPLQSDPRARPEMATGLWDKAAFRAERQMVAAAHPLAAEAGRAMLRQGGSAVDAAIAAQLVLGLVEPQSSGIGGGAFLLHWNAAERRVTSWDGRETAPMRAYQQRFMLGNGKPRDFFDAVVGGMSVGVPGVLRLFETAHDRHGTLPWATLFEPAITLAEQGFPVSERLHALIAADRFLKDQPSTRAYFFTKDGAPLAVGATLRNPAYAALLRTVATDGADAFYDGPIAEDIVRAVRRHPGGPGDLSMRDMRSYQAKERTPVCTDWRDHRVCGMGPPSSGGIAVAQMLGMLDGTGLEDLPAEGPETAHLLAEAGRLAFADRNRYVADADFVPVPVAGLLDPVYLRARGRLIAPAKAMDDAEPGTPPGLDGPARQEGLEPERPSTSHLSIVDAAGNAVSMTTSIENAFGARLMVHGFLLNNQLTDFSFAPTKADGTFVANRVEPGKRPRSSMSPTLVLGPEGDFKLAIGSPGGSNIIGYVAQSLIAILAQGVPPQDAVALPHVTNRDGPTDVEDAALEAPLTALGHQVRVRDMTSGLHAVLRTPDGRLIGAADPRREGVALGD